MTSIPSPSEKFGDVIKYKVKAVSSYRSQKQAIGSLSASRNSGRAGTISTNRCCTTRAARGLDSSPIHEMNRKLSYVHYYHLVAQYVRPIYRASSEWISPHEQKRVKNHEDRQQHYHCHSGHQNNQQLGSIPSNPSKNSSYEYP